MSEISRAAKALSGIVKPVRSVTQKELAARLGCTQQAVSAWLKGASKPDHDRRAKLEEQFGITAASWDEPAESGQLPDTESSDTDAA